MRKMAYFCDTCGRETGEALLQRFEVDKHSYDLCTICITSIVRRVLKDNLLKLRPWCQACKGTGKIEECETTYDHVIRYCKNCEACGL